MTARNSMGSIGGSATLLLYLLWIQAGPPPALSAATLSGPWWKGNTHTHTLWSDGDDYPEMVVGWYRTNGYHFLGLSDHNVVQLGERWIDIDQNKGGRAAFDRYLHAFGADAVASRTENGKEQVRLKTLVEFRPRFEEPGQFLLLSAEEITDSFQNRPIHLNAYPLVEFIPPQHGTSVLNVLQRNIDAVLAQRRQTGRPMIPHVNHPNFGYALTAEDLMQLRGESFFEVYNGHPDVHNEGDETRHSVERMWDIALAFRLTMWKLGPLYGLAVDDSHQYHTNSVGRSNPGRGWIMVNARHLLGGDLIKAMEAGHFYASSGVVVETVRTSRHSLALEIKPEYGVSYLTQFIGTRHGFDPISSLPEDGSRGASRRYSDEIGEILAEVPGFKPHYDFDGDEIYVRAKVISTKPKANPYRQGETETAWIQPVILH